MASKRVSFGEPADSSVGSTGGETSDGVDVEVGSQTSGDTAGVGDTVPSRDGSGAPSQELRGEVEYMRSMLEE